MYSERNTGCEAAGCLVIAFWVAVLVLIATIMGACTTPPPPQPTPEIVYKTLPAPTPLILELPGQTFEVVPQACIDALDGANAIQNHSLAVMEAINSNDTTAFNALMEKMDGIYMEYWTQEDKCRRAAEVSPSS